MDTVGGVECTELLSEMALMDNSDTMGGVESYVMYRLNRNKAQDFWEIMNSYHFSAFLFPLLAVPLTSSW